MQLVRESTDFCKKQVTTFKNTDLWDAIESSQLMSNLKLLKRLICIDINVCMKINQKYYMVQAKKGFWDAK